MTYQIKPVAITLSSSDNQWLPASFQFAVVSLWVHRLNSSALTIAATAHDPHDGSGVAIILGFTAHQITMSSITEDQNLTQFAGTPTLPIGGGWVHIMFSVDSMAGIAQLYWNDLPLTGTPLIPDTFMMAMPPDGELLSSTSIGDCQGDCYINATDTFYDLSIVGNRRKFIDANGLPVDLGADGSIPTGTSPNVYLTVRSGGLATDYLVNHGTSGGTFTSTVDAPTPSFCSSSPQRRKSPDHQVWTIV